MKIARRNVLALAGAALAGGAVHGFALEPSWLEVTRHQVPVPGLPSRLEGLRFAQITDAHLEGIGRLEEKLVEAIQREAPEVVLLTGDLVDSPLRLPVLVELCDAIAASGRKVFGLPGNWEHWGRIPMEALSGAYRRAGAALLLNEHVRVEGVSVTALDDSTGGVPDFAVLGAARGDGPRLLVTHSPALLDRLPPGAPLFDAAIAGHTHGGQIRAPGWAPVLPPGAGRFEAGRYGTPVGPLYVSRGTGTSIVPARFLCRPELPLFTLTRA